MSNSFVYIVESPSADDLFDGRTEGRALCESLALAGHRHSYTVAANKQHLVKALSIAQDNDRLKTQWLKHQCPPVIHFSMHGDADGVQLTSGEYIGWHELRGMLEPVNAHLQSGLLVCLSTCSGYSGTRMSMYVEDVKPFWAVVGSGKDVAWSDALVGFTSFYHHWFKGVAVEDCVAAMRIASGHNLFFSEAGQQSQRGYREYVAKQTLLTNGLSSLGTLAK